MVATAIAVFLAFLSSMSMIFVVLVPWPVIFVAVKYGYARSLITTALAVGLIFLLTNKLTLLMVSIILPVAYLTALALKKRYSAYEGLIISATGCFVGVLLVVLFVYVLTGDTLGDYLLGRTMSTIKDNAQATAMMYELLKGESLTSASTLTQQQMLSYINSPDQQSVLQNAINAAVPIYMMNYVVLGAMINFLVMRQILKKRGVKVGHVPTFSRWALPVKVGRYAIVLYILGMLPQLFSWTSLMLPGLVLTSTIGTIFLIQAMAILDFLLRMRMPATAPRVIVLLLVIVISTTVLPTIGSLLIWLGLFDQLFRIREKMMLRR